MNLKSSKTTQAGLNVKKIQKYIFKVLVMGDTGVGKTSLVIRSTEGRFPDPSLLKSTIGASFALKKINEDENNIVLQLWDFAGQERFRAFMKNLFIGAVAGIFVFDITNPITLDDLGSFWIPAVEDAIKVNFTEQPEVAANFIIVGNKADLSQQRVVSYEEAFKARPLIGVDYPMLRLPVGYSKFGDKLLEISLFHLIQDGYMLKRMPKKINNIQFSPSGKGAILFEDSKVNYYDTQTFTTKELPADIYSVAWTSDESAIYSVIYDDVSKKDTLVRLNLEDDSLEKDIYFLRDIEKYSISVSPDERYVVLLDSTSDIQILYIIDMEEKTRKNVFEGYSITLGEWSRDGDFYVFNGMAKDEDISSSWMLITQDKSVESLGFNVSPRLITGAPDEKFYFFSTQNYSLSGDTRPYFSIFENQDESLVLNDLVNPETLSLHMFDARTRQIYLILELTDVITAVPKKIEINWEGSIVRMLVDDQYFDVKVGE